MKELERQTNTKQMQPLTNNLPVFFVFERTKRRINGNEKSHLIISRVVVNVQRFFTKKQEEAKSLLFGGRTDGETKKKKGKGKRKRKNKCKGKEGKGKVK